MHDTSWDRMNQIRSYSSRTVNAPQCHNGPLLLAAANLKSRLLVVRLRHILYSGFSLSRD